ncbi:hypothetical protein llap_14543 [Limosa lapponica baueri]|uniref:Uncharacterized protein n=1 Tax=Limosa lapponica baueri TaxID=1758121 RepID=A0A2I0TMY6_LIMLA|nr:hypothetical protein llap_14543 [Limosa lapponica baueri]
MASYTQKVANLHNEVVDLLVKRLAGYADTESLVERLDVKVIEPLKLYSIRLKQPRVRTGKVALPSPGQDTAPCNGKLVWEEHG